MGKIIKRTTKKVRGYGWITAMALNNSSPIEFVKLVANMANNERLEGLKKIEINKHSTKDVIIATYKKQVIWEGTIEEVKEYKKNKALQLISLFIARVNEIAIKEKVNKNL